MEGRGTLKRIVAEMARITHPDVERLDYLLPEEFKFGLKALVR